MTFRMHLTDEDHKILQFVEEFGSITITQCQHMYYNRQDQGYEMSRRHLSKLVSYSKLSVFREMNCNKNVYYTNKKPSYHGILVLDYYAQLIKSGVNIYYFKREQPWLNKKYFSDAYCMYSIGDKVYFDIVEVVRTKSVESEKYIEIYNSKEAHDLSNNLYNQLTGLTRDIFPHLVIIDDVRHKNDLFINENIKIIQLDFNLTNFPRLFI